MKKIIPYIASALIIGGLYFYTQHNQISEQSTDNTSFVIIGTSADYPPYEKIDLETGTIIGFDIDVLQEIANRLGKTIKLKDMPFNSLMLNLAADQIDVIAAGLSETDDRKESVLFSDVYLDNDYMVIVTKTTTPNIENITDLYSKRVAVNTGYNADQYLSTMPEINLIRLDSAADSALALQSDSVDAFATSKSSFTVFINNQSNPELYQYFAIENTAEKCAFAFAKKSHLLQKEFNNALTSMKQDGTLKTIQKKWGFND